MQLAVFRFFAFIISLILTVVRTVFRKVRDPIRLISPGLILKRRCTMVSQWVRLNTVFRFLVCAFALSILWGSETLAQSCANYAPVTRTTGITYNSIASSNPSFFTWRNTSSNQNDDNRSYPIPIGFDFWYLGVRYTQITGSLNGTLDFSASTSDGNNGGTGPYGPNYNNLFSTANQTMLALAPLYADLWTANAGRIPIATSVAYQLSGFAPNRVLTVEWINFDEWNVPVNVPAASVNMQVKIYETTGVIEFIYGTMTSGASGGGSYPLRYTCGINNTWSAGAPNATQLLSQQVANTTTFNDTSQNALTILPVSNSKLTFTPPLPTAAPTGLTFTAITQSGMTLNWTDNATNEVGYAVYNSTDDVNFNFISQLHADSTNATVTNLSSGTTYYWKLFAITDGALSSALTANQATLPARTITSIADGNWNAAGTWDSGCVPTAGDNVIIADGTIVTLDVNGSCNSITVGQGVSGQLFIGNDATARILNIGNDVMINSGGTIITGATSATHIMNVGGNLTNNGTLNFTPTTTRVCNITFNKNGNQAISGIGVTTNFNRITLNMGTSNFNVLDVASSNFTATANFLTLTNGTFKLSTGAVVTPFTSNISIPSSCGIWLDDTAANLSTIGGTITLYGLLRATAGTMNIGNAVNNNLISYGGTITIDGGTVNIAGRLDRAGPTILTYFTMSSGTLTVTTVGSTTVGAAPFRIDEVGSTFNMSGGTIIIRRPGAGNLGYVNTGGTVGIVSGGTLQIGDASTPAAQTIQINSTIAVPNLVIGNGVPVTAQLVTNSLFVNNDVSINPGTLNANGLNITLGGTWTSSGGTFTHGTGTVTFNGSATQNIGGSSTTSFNNIVMDNAAGLTINTSPTINGTLTLTNGIITTDSNNVYISSGGSVSRTSGYIVGNLAKFIVTGATNKNFEIGDVSNYTPVAISFGNVSTGGTLTVSTTGTDHPNIVNSGIDASKSVNRFWSLNNSGIVFTNYSATFNFVPGDVDKGANPGDFIILQNSGGFWTQPTIGTRTATSIQATGLSSFSDFIVGEQQAHIITATAGANGDISPYGAVSVNHGSNQAFTITANTGYHFDSLFVDGIHVDSTTSYTFINVTSPHTIHVTFDINQYTIMSTAGVNGVISPSGAVSVNHGSNQAFTITANTGYHFDSLFVDGSHVDSTTGYTFKNVTENHTIYATFRINVYTIVSAKIGNGIITPSGSVNVDFGTDQDFTITPDSHYHLDTLFVDGIHVDSTTSYTFSNITDNHTILAKFVINTFQIMASAETGGTINPFGNVIVNYRANQNFIITPDIGYHFDSLFVDGVHIDSTVSYTFDNVTANHMINAQFAINTYTLTYIAGANGSISGTSPQTVNYGADGTAVTAVANTGYHFVDWSDVSTSNPRTDVNVIGNLLVTAKFAINMYTISATTGTGGTITPAGDVQVNYGESESFEFGPDAGYHVDSLFVDGVHVDSTTSYTFKNVTANHTIYAKFAINEFTITATVGVGGTINPSGAVSVDYGTNKTFIITPNTGYNVDCITVDSSNVDSTTSYTFNNVRENHTISAKFILKKVAIIPTAGIGGSISPSETIYVDYGTNQKFTIAPDIAYNIDSVFVDGVYVDSTVSYTFNNVTTNHIIYAKFVIRNFTITATAGVNGTITPIGMVNVNYGDSVTFILRPDPGYIVDSVFVDNSYANDDTVYVFENVTSNHTIFATFTFTDGVADRISIIPKEYSLDQAYPSPFNPSTTIKYGLPEDSRVTLKVFNVLGQIVAILAEEVQSLGFKSATWTATDFASGMYFYCLEATSIAYPSRKFTQVKKMLLVK